MKLYNDLEYFEKMSGFVCVELSDNLNQINYIKNKINESINNETYKM